MTVESASPNLRPLRMGELLDRIVRLYRQNFLTFIGIVALVQIPLTLFQLVVTLATLPDPDQLTAVATDFATIAQNSGSSLFDLIPVILSFILVQGVGTAALTRAVANNYLGQKTGIIEAYRQIGGIWGKLLVALFLAGIIGLGLGIWWLVVPCLGWFTGLGAIIFFGWVVVPLIAPVIVLEKQSARGAVQRVWGLVRYRFWWVFGFAFLLLLFNGILVAGPTTVANVIFQLAVGDPLSPTTDQLILQSVVETVVNLIFSLLYLPLQLTGFTLLYFDLRIRMEGFDLMVLANEVGSDGSFDAAGALESAPRADSRFSITWNELGYFALISIGFVVIYFGLVSVLLGIATAIGFGRGF